MNNAATQTYTDVLNRKAHILLAHIAAIEREVRALGGGDEMIAAMCEPYHNLLKSIYTEEYPLAKAIEESALPLQQEHVSIVGAVREMDLDLRRFALRQIEQPQLDELRCIYGETADGEAPAWLNKQVKVTGTVVGDGNGGAKLVAVDSVVVLRQLPV